MWRQLILSYSCLHGRILECITLSRRSPVRGTSSLGTLFLGEGQSAQNKRGCHLPLTAIHRTRSLPLSPPACLALIFHLSSDLCFSYVSAHFCFSFCVSWAPLPSSLDFLCDFSVSHLSLSALFLMSLHLSLSLSCLFVSPAFSLQSVSQALSLSLLSLSYLS